MAMMFLSNWLNGYGETGHLAVSSRYLSGREVNFSQNGPLRDALRRGGACRIGILTLRQHRFRRRLVLPFFKGTLLFFHSGTLLLFACSAAHATPQCTTV